jgi:hypothetical protein
MRACEGWRDVQVASGSMGRYNDASWAIDAYSAGRSGRVRASSDLVEYCRRQDQGAGEWGEVRGLVEIAKSFNVSHTTIARLGS